MIEVDDRGGKETGSRVSLWLTQSTWGRWTLALVQLRAKAQAWRRMSPCHRPRVPERHSYVLLRKDHPGHVVSGVNQTDADRGKLEKLTARQPRLRGRPAPMTSHLLACLGDVPPGHTASTRGTESGRSHGDGENCDAPCGA